jgi:hypothetical protein
MRHPMTPAEFDAAVRAILRRVPLLSCTSGGRSVIRNTAVGGNPASKHVIDMARDFVGPKRAIEDGAAHCRILGLWYRIHDVGSGNHLHVQGLPPGDVAEWWSNKYGEENG